MSGDHLERLEAYLDARRACGVHPDHDVIAFEANYDPTGEPRFDLTEDDLRAALDELRAERRSEFRLLLAELEAAKAEARDLQAYMLLVVQRYGYDGKLTFHEGDLRRAQRWLDSLAAEAAPQQPARDGSGT